MVVLMYDESASMVLDHTLPGSSLDRPFSLRSAATLPNHLLFGLPLLLFPRIDFVERGSSAVECRTRNRESPVRIPFATFLAIFDLSRDAPVHSAV